MNTLSVRPGARSLESYYRPLLLGSLAVLILYVFWITSRYPQLFAKAAHIGQVLPAMAYSSDILPVTADAPLWKRILFGAVNWLNGMKVGMTFGVLFGALLHSILQYYPLRLGRNLYLNSVKGALVGAPMGICANCAVPVGCGVTRSGGRIEAVLGFLFSSPNFNPIVLSMTFFALPWTVGAAKYAVLLSVILFLVPATVGWLERNDGLQVVTSGGACGITLPRGRESNSFASVSREIVHDYLRNVWRLVKPTITLMLVASVLSAAMLILIPWTALLSEVSVPRLLLVSLASVFMPVPIALDVMFAAQLYQQGVPREYVMLFAMTLGTFSIVPGVYLWREISRRLAVILFLFFVGAGWMLSLLF